MSPRFTSAITSSPASRAYAQTFSNARTPSQPRASKNADCGFTATACGGDGVDDLLAERLRIVDTIGERVETDDELCSASAATASASRSEKCVSSV